MNFMCLSRRPVVNWSTTRQKVNSFLEKAMARDIVQDGTSASEPSKIKVYIYIYIHYKHTNNCTRKGFTRGGFEMFYYLYIPGITKRNTCFLGHSSSPSFFSFWEWTWYYFSDFDASWIRIPFSVYYKWIGVTPWLMIIITNRIFFNILIYLACKKKYFLTYCGTFLCEKSLFFLSQVFRTTYVF